MRLLHSPSSAVIPMVVGVVFVCGCAPRRSGDNPLSSGGAQLHFVVPKLCSWDSLTCYKLREVCMHDAGVFGGPDICSGDFLTCYKLFLDPFPAIWELAARDSV